MGAFELVLPITGLSFVNSSPTRLTDSTLFTATITGGTGVTYTWNFGDGFVTTTSVTTTSRTYAQAGVYTAVLTATNFNGISVTTRPVTITNSAPVANAGPDQTVSTGATVNLNGSGSSDPDNHTPLTFGWSQTGGTAVTLSSSSSSTPSFTAPASSTVLTFSLSVTDSQGLADATPDTVVITVTDAAITGLSAQNSSPTRLTDATFFTATISAGSNVAYTWNFGDGNFGNGATTSHTYASAGNFTAIVTATNGSGSVSTSTGVVITNQPPVANAGANQTMSVGATVNLNGTGSSDPDNHTPLAYGWTQSGGPAVTLSNSASSTPSFTAPAAPAVLTFALVVTDSEGLASSPDSVVITVNDVAITGLAAQSSSPTRLTDATFFTATISAGSNVVYAWDFGDGNFGSGASASHTYASSGFYNVVVTATNGEDLSTANTSVLVTNSAPVANAGADQSVDVNSTVQLDGSASSDPDGHTPLTYGWAQSGGPAVTLSSNAVQSPTFTSPATPAVLTFTLRVTDSTGLGSSPDTVVINVGDVPLSNLSAASSSPTRLTDATFLTATVTGSNVSFEWSFGDGDTSAGANVNHTYATIGIYTATVTATNTSGTLVATTRVTVTNAAPVANAGSDQSVGVNANVQLNGAGSSDPDGHTPLTYGWSQSGGPAVILSDATSSTPSFPAPSTPTVLTFTLIVTDSQGVGSSPDAVVITVGDEAIAGLSAQSSSPTRLADATFFTATISAGSNVSYVWNFGDGSPTVAGGNATHTYAQAGSYTAIVTATNAAGAVSANTLVNVTNAAPVANAGGDQSAQVSSTVTLNGSGSNDPDGHTPLTYHWAQTGGPAVTLSSSSNAVITFTAPATPAVLTFTLSVTDAQGLAGVAPSVAVVTLGDVPVSGLTAQSSSPTRLTDATLFTATISAGSNVTYTWDFGDGGVLVNGATASHVYSVVGFYTAAVTATNSAGEQSVIVPVTVTNDAPIANAGADQNVSISGGVTLNGLGSSDPDGHTPLAYEWTQTGGPAVVLSSNAASAPTFTAPATPTVLTFTLTVTDNTGLPAIASDEVVINVIDIGIVGLAAQSSSPTRLTDATFFTATVSAGSGVTYLWNFGDGSPEMAGVTASHTYAQAGSFNAVVTATNGPNNVTASTVVVVTNVAPVPNAGADQSVTIGSNVTLSGSGVDPDNHLPLSYRWQQTGGPAVTLSSNTIAVVTFTAPATPAVLTFTLSVTDAQGLVNAAPDTVVVTVTDVPVSGLSAANSSPTRLGNNTLFTASVSGGSNVVYTWNFGDGSFGSGANASHVYAKAGSYTAIVTATNSAGAASANVAVAVTNQQPVANAGANQNVSIGGLVNLNGTGSTDPDNHLPLTYRWTQVAGQAVTLSGASSAIASFTAPNTSGTLTFQLVVTDAYGLASAPSTVVISVKDIGIAGLAVQSSSPTTLGGTTTFTASVTAGSGVSYSWNFGDGTPAVSGANVTHTYAAAGSYTAIVTATNSNGSVNAQTVVTVVETKKYIYLPITLREE